MKRKASMGVLLTFLLIAILLTPGFRVEAGEKSPPLLIVNGMEINLDADASIADGCSYVAATKTLVLADADLEIDEGYANGDNRCGIYARAIDLTISLTGDNAIALTGDDPEKQYIAIQVVEGDLAIAGSGSLAVTGRDRSIHVDGRGFADAGRLTFRDSVSVETFGEICVETQVEENDNDEGVLILRDTAHVMAQNGFWATNGFQCADTARLEDLSGGGDPPPAAASLYVGGVDILAEGAALPDGVMIDSRTENGVTLRLEDASIETGRTDGHLVAGIYANGIDLTVTATDSSRIEVGGLGPEFTACGIYVRDGGLEIGGDGNLAVAGAVSVWVEGQDRATNLTFRDDLQCELFGEMKAEMRRGPEAPGEAEDGKIQVLDRAKVQCYGGYFSSFGPLIKDAAAFYNPPTFRIDGREYIVATDELSAAEVTIAAGTGWEIAAVGEQDEESGQWSHSVNLLLTDYSGDAIEALNFDGFLVLAGAIDIDANAEGYALVLKNAHPQVWAETGMVPEIRLQGGIRLFYSALYSWYAGDWQIGDAAAYAAKGIEGTGGPCGLQITKDSFSVYSDGVAVSGLDELVVEDGGIFTAVANGAALENVRDVVVSTGGRIDIGYDGVTSVLADDSIRQGTYLFKSRPGAAGVFPVADRYFVNCKNGTFVYFQPGDDLWAEPDDSVNGQPLAAAEIKYTLSDENRRYLFASTANRITRVFADDSGEIVGGTLEVMSINGYRYGGYVAEVGSVVHVKLLPDAGYQYKPGTLRSSSEAVPLTPTADPAVYTFVMPTSGVALGCEFEEASDTVATASSFVASASVLVPDGEIQHGNAAFSVADAEVSAADAEKIAAAAGGDIGAYLDLSLQQVITKDGDPGDVWATPITALSDEMAIELTLSAELRGKADYGVVRMHQGEADLIPAHYHDGVLEFESDRFSTYAVIYKDKVRIGDMKDIKAGDWFYDDVAYVLSRGIMKGVKADLFSPKAEITRAQFIAVLGRTAGIADASGGAPVQTGFSDVKPGAYYASHVAWGLEKGITNGTGPNTFAPNAPITRQDMVTMMARYAELMEIALPAAAAAFADDDAIAPYAKTAVYRMKAAGIVQGKGNNRFAPKAGAQRAEAAKIIHQLLEMGAA